MAATTVLALSDNDFKVRWREPYVSEALNRKVAGVIPRGVYRGLALTTHAAPLTVQLAADAAAEHLAVYETLAGYSLTIRRGGGAITINLAAFVGQTVYIALFAVYSTVTVTSAEIRVYTIADYNLAPEKPELVILGTVAVPGAGVIPASALSLAAVTVPWKQDSSVAGRPWQQIVRNGSFDEPVGIGPFGLAQSIPGFRAEVVAGSPIGASLSGAGRDGTNALLLVFNSLVDVLRVGPGVFDSAKPLSGGTVPVSAGQLVDVSFWLSGVAVTLYTAGTNGLRFVLRFYDELTETLQSTGVIYSDPSVHIGTFGYTQLSDVFVAPVSGYFTWYLEGSMNLVLPVAAEFRVDDLRIFLEPRDTATDDGDNAVTVPSLRALALDVLPDTALNQALQGLEAARFSLKESGADVVLSLSRAGDTAEGAVPRWDTPFNFKKVDQSFVQAAVGLSGTNSTADQDTIPHAYKLLHAYRTSQTDQVRVRIYASPAGAYVVTVNARWGGGGSQLWFPDNTAVDAMKFTVGVNGPRWESRDSVLPASWADSAWNGTVGAGTGLTNLLFQASLRIDNDDSEQPMWRTTKDAADHPGFPGNVWKLVSELPMTSARNARMYVGVGSDSGNFCITMNAEWDVPTQEWVADSTTDPALMFGLRCSTGNTVRLLFHYQDVTASPWADSAWVTDTGDGSLGTARISGDVEIGGEYKYRVAREKRVMIPLPLGNPLPYNGWSFVLPTVSDPGYWLSPGGIVGILFPIRVPDDYELTSVELLVNPASTNFMACALYRTYGIDFSPAADGDIDELDTDSVDGALQTVTLGATNTLSNGSGEYLVFVFSGFASAAGDRIHAVSAIFQDQGPLND